MIPTVFMFDSLMMSSSCADAGGFFCEGGRLSSGAEHEMKAARLSEAILSCVQERGK
jgi:hypothetical protein